MKANRILFLNVIFFLSIALYSCDEGNSPMNDVDNEDMTDGDDQMTGDNTTDATLAPDFSLTNLSDQTVTLSTYKGKVVVLFFFGNACPPCKGIAPSIQSQLADVYASNDKFVVLGIDQWDGKKASVQGFRSSTSTTFPLLQKGSSVASKYKTTYDRLVVIDKEGYIQFKGTRGASSDLSTVKTKVKDLLK